MRGRVEISAFWITFILVFGVYALTSAPGLGLVDCGELTVAANTLSIAHPTGYPLYVMLGRLWLTLHLFDTARAMVVLSCLLGALACGFLTLIGIRLLKRNPANYSGVSAILMAAASIAFALSPTAWKAVSFAEVYPLTWLIASIILYAAVSASFVSGSQSVRWTMLCVYLWGLSFGNHLTILWFAPLVVYCVYSSARRAANPVVFCLFCAGLFVAGLTVNLVLPVRSSVQPPLDWSDPQTWDGLIRHLTAWQYRVWMFKGTVVLFLQKLVSYFGTVPEDIGWGLTIAFLLGLWHVLRRKDWLMGSAVIAWILGVAYNLNYDIPDIDTYFLSLYGPVCVIAMFGLYHGFMDEKKKIGDPNIRRALFGVLIVALPLSGLAASGTSAVQSSNRFAKDFAEEILHTLPQDALVIQGNWDIQSPVIYLQKVEKKRTDVVMLDLNLLQRPWYLRQEMRAHPGVFAGCEKEIADFIRDVAPFEAGKRFDSQRLESVFLTMVNGIISRQMTHRPVYVRDMQVYGHPGIAANMKKSPAAFFIRLGELPPVEEPVLNPDAIMSGRTDFSERERFLLKECALSCAMRGMYALRSENAAVIERMMSAALAFDAQDSRINDFVRNAELRLNELKAK